MPDLDLSRFRTVSHLPIVSLERALQVAMTGLSSRSGSLLTVQFFGLPQPAFQGGPGVDNPVQSVWVVIMHEKALSLSKYGTMVSE